MTLTDPLFMKRWGAANHFNIKSWDCNHSSSQMFNLGSLQSNWWEIWLLLLLQRECRIDRPHPTKVCFVIFQDHLFIFSLSGLIFAVFCKIWWTQSRMSNLLILWLILTSNLTHTPRLWTNTSTNYDYQKKMEMMKNQRVFKSILNCHPPFLLLHLHPVNQWTKAWWRQRMRI